MLVQRVEDLGGQFSRLLAPLITPEVFNQELPLLIILFEPLELDCTATASGNTHDVREQADHRIRAYEHDGDANVVHQVEEEVQHAFLTSRLRQVEVLQLINK
ncbi:hypothetical protein D3C79_788670 [compost metagenome]